MGIRYPSGLDSHIGLVVDSIIIVKDVAFLEPICYQLVVHQCELDGGVYLGSLQRSAVSSCLPLLYLDRPYYRASMGSSPS